ncbi:MAG: hypothetical protein ACD_57C00026G0001 [uncultured bacterium]|uniref:Peptidase A2 domain-containing protein n=1 Tax=Candidatus Woesebacteria bacterium RIFCSPLOWO2_01_FULL_39_21 TaxID=1802519 RepID=A0A1F8BD46_9BACT|nr:MAG: hypothetical protein ACD_57C00026G0001 [uncultured bacterium]OGM22529.1 MAG: hypothetical protein A2691_04665 [Candidatus Woesebacteria bacterium RIFCSPHIGHO2_01_FULL_39_23]OGM61974.1 MAG: hypothetical protein A2961_02830 [Candidatus Woesebacteria bacterium RIFCSPLOWO2_01_FULL_39_21]
MQFKFPFEVVRNDKIPFLDIKITNKENGKSVSYRAMLDSGAYTNVFHADIARVLDIDLSMIKQRELFSGVKDTKKQMKGRAYIVELMVVQKGKSHQFDSYIVFSEEISNTGWGLLGRQGFFDQFDEVSFNYKNNKFYLHKG